ncbi:MAG: ABC transporter ATP-binding protein [Gemmatimonadota bacterium]|nr:ABC transporter ATP-binding protein [Gemmatimonadota bacterium]
MSFELTSVTVRYSRSARPALTDISHRFAPGTHTAILGPNGAGKSTLLRVLLGTVRPESGRVTAGGQPVTAVPRRRFAREVAFVSDREEISFPIGVREYVALGRYPHVGPLAPLRARDEGVVEASLETFDLARLASRRVADLSAGERQRARLARALAQEPGHLLLDEPTAHLDPGHQVETLERIAELTAKTNLTIVHVTHDVNLASRFADRFVLLAGGRLRAAGPAGDVLRRDRLEEAFGCAFHVTNLDGLGRVAVPTGRRPRGGVA